MEALHVHTYGMHCERCTQAVEQALSGVDGVVTSIAVKSLDVTSVLYEPLAVRPEAIAEAIRSVGFEAEVLQPDEMVRSAQVSTMVA